MVLIEAISIIVRRVDVDARYAGGWGAFERDVPNRTLRTDGELACVDFMSPVDLEAYVGMLQQRGLRFQHDGKSMDIAVVDQYTGPTAPCDWLDLRRLDLGPGVVAAAALKHSRLTNLATPEGWSLEQSLSQGSLYVPADHVDKGMKFLRHENGLDVYRSKLTGGDVYMGRAGSAAQKRPEERSVEWTQIEAVAKRALELDLQSEQARSSRDVEWGARIYGELMDKLLPEAKRLADTSVRYGSFANYVAGLVLRVLQLYEPAVDRLKRSLTLKPAVINTLLEITHCLGQLGRTEEAEKYATLAIEAGPQSAAAWGNLAMCLIQSRKKKQAQEALEHALKLDPENPKNNYIAANFERYFN